MVETIEAKTMIFLLECSPILMILENVCFRKDLLYHMIFKCNRFLVFIRNKMNCYLKSKPFFLNFSDLYYCVYLSAIGSSTAKKVAQ
jgi:hypothetical protein